MSSGSAVQQLTDDQMEGHRYGPKAAREAVISRLHASCLQELTTEISGSTIVSAAIIFYPHRFRRTSDCRPSSAHVATVPCTFSYG
jgi:hypothetical protein